MGKDIDLQYVAGSLRMGLTKAVLQNLMDGISDNADSLVRALIPNYVAGEVVILYGCNDTNAAAADYDVLAGAVYYDGEIYLVDATSGVGLVNVLVGTITTSYVEATIHSDATTKNVARVKKMVISDAVSGTGTKDFLSWKNIHDYGRPLVTEIDDTTGNTGITSGASYSTLGTATYTTPADGKKRSFLVIGKFNAKSLTAFTSNSIQARIYDGSTEQDYLFLRQDSGTATDSVFTGATLIAYLTDVAPGTVISLQKQWIAGSWDITDVKLILKQI